MRQEHNQHRSFKLTTLFRATKYLSELLTTKKHFKIINGLQLLALLVKMDDVLVKIVESHGIYLYLAQKLLYLLPP